MTTLICGFIILVLVPAAVLSLVLGRMSKAPLEVSLDDDNPRFTMSSDVKPGPSA